jgi:hypothetical protein
MDLFSQATRFKYWSPRDTNVFRAGLAPHVTPKYFAVKVVEYVPRHKDMLVVYVKCLQTSVIETYYLYRNNCIGKKMEY